MSNCRIEDVRRYTDIFRALANPHRLSIFLRLVRCCEPGPPGDAFLCVGELGQDLDIAPSTISHHIKELRHAGLIQMERRGQTIQCSIPREAFRDLTELLEGLTSEGALLCGYEGGEGQAHQEEGS
jgi:ArsR family transcriptional regulator